MINNRKNNWRSSVLIALFSILVTSCGHSGDENRGDEHGHGHGEEAAEFEKGIHGGRLLEDKSFVLELSIFETGVPPEFHARGFDNDKPLDPKAVDVKIKLTRLGNKVETISFVPDKDFLRSTSSIYEPHSFSVNVTATYKGKAHQWQYESFEGRTRIDPKVAAALSIQTEIAGPATLEETVDAYGSVIADPALERAISARFDGVITAVHVQLGDRVTQGQSLFTVESNESLKPVIIRAPIAGAVVENKARAGEQTGSKTLMRILDNSTAFAEVAIFPKQISRVKPGATVTINHQGNEVKGVIDNLAAEVNSNQSITARVKLEKGELPLGAHVGARIKVDEYKVPLAVKRIALQNFRDFTVVYAQVGDEYEVRMLELGRAAGD
ncbi:MAG: HlyD family efflux transporter periplasmic adaptor subunit, partial [Proteobacteria bacterium]